MKRINTHYTIAPRTNDNLRRLQEELDKPMSRLIDEMTDLYRLIVFSKKPIVCRRAKNDVIAVEYQVNQQ